MYLRNRFHLILFSGLLIVFNVCWPQPVVAQKKKVVVLPFSGPSAATARGGLVKALQRKANPISPVTYTNTGNQLGVDPSAASSMVAICSKLKCDAVIQGAVSRKGRRFTITVTVYDGGTGEVIGVKATTARGARRVVRSGKALGTECTALVQKGKYVRQKAAPQPAPHAARPRIPPLPTTPPPSPAARKADISDIPQYKPLASKTESAPDKKAITEEKKESEEEGIDQRTRKKSLSGLFDVSVGIGLASRRYVLAVAAPTPTSPKDSSYEGSVYSEITFHADLYPLVPFIGNFFRNIGFGASYSRHLSNSSWKPNQTDLTIDTTSQELLLDIQYRWTILKKATSPVVSVLAGWGLRDFTLGQNDVLASLKYRFFRFGAEAIVPLGTPLMALFAGGDARPLIFVGQEAVYAWGSKNGGFGYSFRGGVRGRHSSGFFFLVTAEYLSFRTSFDGFDPSDMPRPGFPDRTEGTKGSDRFIRMWGGAGYAL